MIDESLFKSNFVGKDGFVWWIGRVANPKVWRTQENTSIEEGKWAYRCKVRIVGYHTFDTNILKDEDLPWAHILTSAADGAPAMGGFGKLPTLIGGESVMGFFLDGEEAQQPVVMSTFYKTPSVSNIENPTGFDPFSGIKNTPLDIGFGQNLTRGKADTKGVSKDPPKNTVPGGPAVTASSGSSTIPGNSQDASVFASTESQASKASTSYKGNSKDFTTSGVFSSTISLSSGSNGPTDYSSAFSSPSNTLDSIGAAFGAPNLRLDQLFCDDKADLAFCEKVRNKGPVAGENGCSENIISKIIAALQSFIGLINRLESTVNGFIDPVLNLIYSFQDIENIACAVARLIMSILKFVINGVRDNIMVVIGDFFALFGITIPQPQQPISENVSKNVMNVIFCIFEKLFDLLLNYLCNILKKLPGKAGNVPTCAAEEITAAVISKMSEAIEDSISPIFSGLDWLSGGISDITSAISGGLSIINQILSFLSCDTLSCESTYSWDPFGGITFPSSDSWASVLGKVGALGGLGSSIDGSIGYLSVYGSPDSPFPECRETIINPQYQGDQTPLPFGVQASKCIPPEITITGDGFGAEGLPIVSNKTGSILTILVKNPGRGYTRPPEIRIVDRTNYGNGAVAGSKINQSGEIESIYIIRSGRGYCPPNLGGDETTTGVSTSVVGVSTNIVVVNPGVGYTDGDAIFVGDCIYNPVVTPRGSIVGIKSLTNCPTNFEENPGITINTRTGQGAVLYPVIQFTPQSLIDRPVGVPANKVLNIVDCV